MASVFSAVVIAGGQGTRFWPLSRTARPKQFMRPEAHAPSLIQATANRFSLANGCEGTFVVTNVAHGALAREHLPTAQVIEEPCPRNTAAAIGLAALHVHRHRPDSVMIVLPSDHAITGEEGYQATIQRAVELARTSESLVTIGIPPTEAHTGYGYIQRGEALTASSGGFRVKRFVEKPNKAKAESLIAEGGYFWNSGQFAFRTDVILRAIAEHLPELSSGLSRIAPSLGTADEKRIVSEVFPSLPSISIDYGILEKAANVSLVEASGFTWNDIGSWDAWAQEFEHDHSGNVLEGDVISYDSRNSFVVAGERLVALVGVDNLVVVDTPDALLVCRSDRAQEVKEIVAELRARGRGELL